MGTAGDASLEDLLKAANRGDQRAYIGFLTAVTPLLRGIARSRGSGLGNEVCEDIVQETLLAIHQKRHTWREELPVRPWLYAIVRYKVVDAFRSRGRRIHMQIDDFAESIAAAPDVDLTVKSDMDRVISQLDDRSAKIVRSIGIEGDSIADVSDKLGMTETAVRVALHRGLKKLSGLRERMIE